MQRVTPTLGKNIPTVRLSTGAELTGALSLLSGTLEEVGRAITGVVSSRQNWRVRVNASRVNVPVAAYQRDGSQAQKHPLQRIAHHHSLLRSPPDF